MKKGLLCTLVIANLFFVTAQEKKSNYTFYGFIRNDFYYNSRMNKESSDGLSVAYPLDIKEDANGVDLNAVPQSEMLSIASRLGVDISGIEVLGAKSTGKIETDFQSTSGTTIQFRLRHAYMNLNWGKVGLLTGQTWHPLTGEVRPSVLNLNSGSPFQPFARSPQVSISYKINACKFFTTAVYQLQYASDGPLKDSKSTIYLKNANMPELYVGIENKNDNWIIGAGAEMKKIVPRTSAAVNDSITLKVDESLSSYACNIYVQYQKSLFRFKTKLFLGQNMSDLGMISGYGISSLDTISGKQTYTPLNTFSSWLNIVYGNKWQVGLYAGYTRNLGSSKSLYADSDGLMSIYGCGISGNKMIGSLYKISPQLSFNLDNFQAAIEYDYTVAEWGYISPEDGIVRNTKNVLNHRILAVLAYVF